MMEGELEESVANSAWSRNLAEDFIEVGGESTDVLDVGGMFHEGFLQQNLQFTDTRHGH
jgi:hypothetical protein